MWFAFWQARYILMPMSFSADPRCGCCTTQLYGMVAESQSVTARVSKRLTEVGGQWMPEFRVCSLLITPLDGRRPIHTGSTIHMDGESGLASILTGVWHVLKILIGSHRTQGRSKVQDHRDPRTPTLNFSLTLVGCSARSSDLQRRGNW